MSIMTVVIIVLVAVVILVIGFVVVVSKQGGGKSAAKAEYKYTAKSLLNQSEIRVLAALDTTVPAIFGPDARIFTQVSYGEFLKGDSRGAFQRVNARRADFVVADKQGNVLRVIEYQGSGHYGNSNAAREKAKHGDNVKRSSLASAGLKLVEIPAKFTQQSVAALLA